MIPRKLMREILMQTVKDILHQRAKEAAKSIEAEIMEDVIEIICFKMGNDVYALEDRFVQELYPYMLPTKVPCTPEFVLGIVNIRGNFISVVDLELFLGMKKNENSKEGFILLCSNKKMEFALKIEEILDGIKISAKSIQPLPQSLNIKKEELIEGVTQEGVILLSGKKLLEDSRIVVHEEIN
jgi:purine-binding chemotaxis protein CheW